MTLMVGTARATSRTNRDRVARLCPPYSLLSASAVLVESPLTSQPSPRKRRGDHRPCREEPGSYFEMPVQTMSLTHQSILALLIRHEAAALALFRDTSVPADPFEAHA